MTMEVTGAAVLAAIAKSPSSFAMNDTQVNALAMATLLGRFKDKALNIANLRSIAQAIGRDDFRLALDHLNAKDSAALAKRLDPKHPDLRGASEAWHRDHLWKLAEGSTEPMAATLKPAPRKPPTASVGSKTGEVMKSKALKQKPETKTKPRSKKAANSLS